MLTATQKSIFMERGVTMNTRLINFEGIHGSGKSACAWNLYNNLKKNDITAEVFLNIMWILLSKIRVT